MAQEPRAAALVLSAVALLGCGATLELVVAAAAFAYGELWAVGLGAQPRRSHGRELYAR